ncbi:DUF2913 family protein [Shewanella intestini]|uniref:DUF2913 family protein n=1 Tax=Shewanella intestini TaxID=2017544 RepID=A0ABS5HXZ2_9GAMM|nr:MULTISPECIES: DUF2913 family protein [Shewanella]MBR9726567.1 DUF2913 family protein [Shewanella intestini]MRG34867.1 DUF2913 family protein [Shewanella sp. XMDDZSB0408]
MTAPTYNQAILELAQAGLNALNQWSAQFQSPRTPAQQSHYLCSWMVESLKLKRFDKLVADNLNEWIRNARSQGAGAQLPQLLSSIVHHYTIAKQYPDALGDKLQQLLTALDELDWLVVDDASINAKLKLASNGAASIVVSVDELEANIQAGELISPITLYARGNETQLGQQALQHGIILTPGNKKASLIKHHKAYQIGVANQLTQLCLLTPFDA